MRNMGTVKETLVDGRCSFCQHAPEAAPRETNNTNTRSKPAKYDYEQGILCIHEPAIDQSILRRIPHIKIQHIQSINASQDR